MGAPLLNSDVRQWAERRAPRDPALLLNCMLHSEELREQARKWFHTHGWGPAAWSGQAVRNYANVGGWRVYRAH